MARERERREENAGTENATSAEAVGSSRRARQALEVEARETAEAMGRKRRISRRQSLLRLEKVRRGAVLRLFVVREAMDSEGEKAAAEEEEGEEDGKEE